MQVVPAISSSVAGPLGAVHLPRLWLKILLHALGKLPEGYRHGTGGFDETTCMNLGIDAEAFQEFITTTRPTYLESEAWVRAHATHLGADAIARHNAAILSRDKSTESAVEQRAEIGIPDWNLTNAVKLNDLDDWTAIHRSLTKQT